MRIDAQRCHAADARDALPRRAPGGSCVPRCASSASTPRRKPNCSATGSLQSFSCAAPSMLPARPMPPALGKQAARWSGALVSEAGRCLLRCNFTRLRQRSHLISAKINCQQRVHQLRWRTRKAHTYPGSAPRRLCARCVRGSG
jgi:hypothetical protein